MSTVKKIFGIVSTVFVVLIIFVDRILRFWQWWAPLPSLSETLKSATHRNRLSIHFSAYVLIGALYALLSWLI